MLFKHPFIYVCIYVYTQGSQKETSPIYKPLAAELFNQSKWIFRCSYSKLQAQNFDDLKQ